MERNYKVIRISDRYYIQLETYSNYKAEWIKHIFKDMNMKKLIFFSKKDAESWIDTRRDIMKI